MKNALSVACAIAIPLVLSQTANAQFDYFETDGSFKRFSISAGWLHASPSGDPTPIQNSTAVPNGYEAQNGSVTAGTVKSVVDPNQSQEVLDGLAILNGLPNGTDLSNITGIGDVSGSAEIYGLESFATPGTGLEADDVNTLGLLINYHITDNWSIESKAGFPPKVDILGKGTVIAPFSGLASSPATPDFKIKKDIEITDMTQGSNGVASTARAWLPAVELHYQFGQSGVNQFRPYVGVGAMYAYFNDIELDSGIGNDLVRAGHMIENIRNNKAGASLENLPSDSGMRVEVKADAAWAPIVTLGATYDFDESWFAVGSVSYAKLDSDTTITVENDAGEELIRAVTNIDIDPYITYLGVGYRF